VAEYDRKCRAAAIQIGVSIYDKSRDDVKEYWKKRAELITTWKKEAVKSLAEMRTAMNNAAAAFPPNVKKEFEETADRALDIARKAVDEPYGDDDEGEAKMRQERLAKSKKAKAAMLEYALQLSPANRAIFLAANTRLKAAH